MRCEFGKIVWRKLVQDNIFSKFEEIAILIEYQDGTSTSVREGKIQTVGKGWFRTWIFKRRDWHHSVNDIADQQHKDILQNIRSTKSLPSTVTCGGCQVETLKPDHKPVPGNAGNKVCPLGQVKCSCCFKGKIACPNNICGAIYDYIVQHHASTPPVPDWKNSDARNW
ncbi:uncharacterized protein LOC132749540 [Ruditapes philippinarum]|uniref:uncharacterized protein LOC132749540 n=1 Tax=Ruditapes philippinarum TaxID=129788 RepID=UPI00295A99C1|nr:uncharacterized protein LOC132749540 [Ruditapes philippinarum]